MRYMTKKLDKMHIINEDVSMSCEAMCGKTCLGNNYARHFTEDSYGVFTDVASGLLLPSRALCEKCVGAKR